MRLNTELETETRSAGASPIVDGVRMTSQPSNTAVRARWHSTA
jgi:hypothetical protein